MLHARDKKKVLILGENVSTQEERHASTLQNLTKHRRKPLTNIAKPNQAPAETMRGLLWQGCRGLLWRVMGGAALLMGDAACCTAGADDVCLTAHHCESQNHQKQR